MTAKPENPAWMAVWVPAQGSVLEDELVLAQGPPPGLVPVLAPDLVSGVTVVELLDLLAQQAVPLLELATRLPRLKTTTTTTTIDPYPSSQ
jgi:hypothetical protein